jgi:hypothetical protein
MKQYQFPLPKTERIYRKVYTPKALERFNHTAYDGDEDYEAAWVDSSDDPWLDFDGEGTLDRPILPITLSLLRTMRGEEDYHPEPEVDDWDFPDFDASPGEANDIEDDLPPDEPSGPVIW